jgi:hypothetical protein
MPSRSKLHNSKSHRKSHRKQNNKNSKNSQYSKKRLNSKKNKSKKSHSTKRTQRGGFDSCSLATVQEPGFTIPAIGDVPGFSLSDSKGAINRSNCKTDTYQAMTPA